MLREGGTQRTLPSARAIEKSKGTTGRIVKEFRANKREQPSVLKGCILEGSCQQRSENVHALFVDLVRGIKFYENKFQPWNSQAMPHNSILSQS